MPPSKKNDPLLYFNKIAKLYDTHITKGSYGLKYIDKYEITILLNTFPINQQNIILDIGAGTGRITNKLLINEPNIVALDSSPGMLSIARNKIGNINRVFFLIASADELPIRNKVFDRILSVRVLHYVKNWKKALSEISRVMKKNGLVLISVNNLFSFSLIAKFFGLMKGKLINPFVFSNEMEKRGFSSIKLNSYIHIPIFFYSISNSKLMLNFFIILDKNIGLLTRKLIGVRFYVFAKNLR